MTSPRSQGAGTPTPDVRTGTGSPLNEASNESDTGKHQDATVIAGSDADADAAEDVISLLLTRVFTLLTDCYSPTCCRDRFYYLSRVRDGSSSRLNMKPQPGLGIKR